ncbi:MAG: hypothetical protein EAZ91_00335 [Cytophagales bacterium]|nr:MAG: hypothetical protein EAZ91_00335 [Cytophagales bacterium]
MFLVITLILLLSKSVETFNHFAMIRSLAFLPLSFFIILFCDGDSIAQESTFRWAFPKTSLYTWDVGKTNNVVRLMPNKQEAKQLIICTLDEHQLSFGSSILINIKDFKIYVSKTPRLGVKKAILEGYASVTDPILREALGMKNKIDHGIKITMWLGHQNQPTAVIMVFPKKYQSLCIFQDEQSAKAFWPDL